MRLSSPLKIPIYYERLQSPLASFSALDDLNVTASHCFGHLGPRASPGTISLDLVTNEFINGLLGANLIDLIGKVGFVTLVLHLRIR